MSVLSWQAGAASGSFLTGTIIQALIGVNNADYQPANWQGTLLVFAMALLIYICNIWGARELPLAQTFLVVLHVLAFLAVIIVLWAMAPHQSATAVFTEFSDRGGWPNVGLSLMIGQISAIFASTCTSIAPAAPSYCSRIYPLTTPQAPTPQPICPKKSKTQAATYPWPCSGHS